MPLQLYRPQDLAGTSEGLYVRAEDYAKLEAENARLREGIKVLDSQADTGTDHG
jgi:hypothetical protein